MSDQIVLYSWYRSSCAWRVRNTLNWKKIPYSIVSVELNTGRQNDAKYLERNPMGQVPALSIDGITISQSVVILEYLEETRPERPLLPKDPKKRAEVRRIVETIVSGIQPHQNLPGLDIPAGTPEEWKFAWSRDWARHWIEKGFLALEKLLANSSGKYCVGDEVTFADVCLVPQVYNARLYKMDLTPFPNIVRINSNLMQLEEFIAAHPSKQPDCPKEYRDFS